ncbi:MAG: hypothetical protein HZB16_14930 [Armatimonadetes bacterium]|nr:hypothetical protein [Armatimonadota bacterium]
MRRRQLPFGPSLAMSVCINVALFAGLQPIRVDIDAKPTMTVRRLSGMAVQDAITRATPIPVATPLPAPTTRPAIVPPRPRASTSALKVARVGNSSRPAGRPGANAPAVSSAWKPADRGRAGAPLGPTGGDGTRAVPQGPKAGAGDPLTALAMEPGTPNGPTGVPALGGPSGLSSAPRVGVAMWRPGPPVLFPGLGERGGTPTAPALGNSPLAGVAGSGDNPNEIAPRTANGWTKPLSPTTDGYRLSYAGGKGLPTLRGGLTIPGMPVDPIGSSGGGGGTAALVGLGGGGQIALAGAPRDYSRGGGGSGMVINTGVPGGTAIGPGPGGTGGGGTGFAPFGGGSGMPGGSLTSLTPATTTGLPSVLAQIGRGLPNVVAVRPGARAAGPGGAPVDIDPADARGNISPGLKPGGGGGGQPGGQNGGGGAGTAVATRRGNEGGGPTGVIVDTMALLWHHYPGSYDLHVGSVTGPRIATIGVVRLPSMAAARASTEMQRNGRSEPLVIRPLAIDFVAKEGQGARQRVAISASDAAALRKSGMLSQPSRIVTVWKGNIRQD